MMPLRVAHLSNWWKAGAVAMVRTHEALLDAGVQSRIHSVQAIDSSLRHGHQVHPVANDRRSRKLPWKREVHPWKQKMKQARRSGERFEVFSPPLAIKPHDVSGVLNDIDILHLHWIGTHIDFEDFFARVRVPVVWTLHDQNAYFGGFHYQGDLDSATSMLPLEYESRAIKRRVLSPLNLAVAANSRWNAGLAMTTGVLPERTLVDQIYYPLPADRYQPLPKPEAKACFGIEADRFVIGFACGSLDNRRKGFYDLVEAIHQLDVDIRGRTTLLSFGDSPSKEVRSRIDVRWQHLGRVSGGDQQSRVYSAMDTFVIPSIEEAFGQTPLEALACRTAVVGTRSGGIPETVIPGETGLLANPRSPHQLAACLTQLFASPQRRRQFADAGRKLAVTRHDPKRIAAKHVDLYKRLIDRHDEFAVEPIRRAA